MKFTREILKKKMQIIENQSVFHHPFTLVVSGSTGSGKTEWIMRFLANSDAMIDSRPKNILYCYGEMNPNIVQLQREEVEQEREKLRNGFEKGRILKTFSGVPSEEMIKAEAENANGNLLVILDDLMVNLKNTFLDTLFTCGSHNWGVSVALITQHLFAKELRTARNNAHYIVLMRNPAGELQVRNLATQIFPLKFKSFLEAYKDATRERYSYLLIDMHPSTDERLRLKTNIFPNELTMVYIPRD